MISLKKKKKQKTTKTKIKYNPTEYSLYVGEEKVII